MDRETTIQDDEILPSTKHQHSPLKQQQPGTTVSGSGGGGDRLKRDEWSVGAVTILLEAYESKWILRNRAKLKGQDWEDVAKSVSSRSNNSKSPKTQTQCKNKIESMKKRYRSESAISDTSSWPLYSRLDHLLRDTGVGSHGSLPTQPMQSVKAFPLLPLEPLPFAPSLESNDVDPMVKENDELADKLSLSDHVTEKNNTNDNHHTETDSGTPALYSNDKDMPHSNRVLKTKKRKRRSLRDDSRGCWEDVAESIRLLADAVVRTEQARMDTMRELERIGVEAEAKRGEMDLKRTEIIANTQLDIARLFASIAGKNVNPSLRIGRL